MGYCIVHNPLLLQPLRHWFTFIFRKYEHLAVGSWGKGLTRSRGHPHFVVALPSPFVPLLYHNLGDLSRGFYIFLKLLITAQLSLLLLTSLTLYHNLGDLSRASETGLLESSPFGVFNLPLTPIVYHRSPKKSRTFPKKFLVSTR